MTTAKETYRDVEQGVKKTMREADGHDLGDDVANAGDEIRKDLGNAGDAIRRGVDDAGNAVRRGVDDLADTNVPGSVNHPVDDTWKR